MDAGRASRMAQTFEFRSTTGLQRNGFLCQALMSVMASQQTLAEAEAVRARKPSVPSAAERNGKTAGAGTSEAVGAAILC